MSDKPKKVLTTEQLAKMQEGRKKAYEARKKAREVEKVAKQQAKIDAKKEQEEAIRQQKEQRELIKKAAEEKKKKKGELAALKQKQVEEKQPTPEPELEPEPEETEDEKYQRVFETASLKVLETLPNNAKELFKKANSKFDCGLSVDDNIKSMINFCKDIIKANVETSKVVKQHVVEKQAEQAQVVQPPKEQVVAEKEIEQRIYTIMKRFK